LSKLITIGLYLTAFWNTVVVNCIQPVNWQYCSKDLDVWLWPEIQRGIDLMTGEERPYQEESGTMDE